MLFSRWEVGGNPSSPDPLSPWAADTTGTTRPQEPGYQLPAGLDKMVIIVIADHGKFEFLTEGLCLLFDRKTVSVTKKYIISNHLTIIGMILMTIRISLPKTN